MDDVREDIAKGDEFVTWFIEAFQKFLAFIEKVKALFAQEG